MIAKNLKFLRKFYKEKQEELATYLGVTQSTLSDYERGKLPIPDELLRKIAHHYIISIYELTNTDLSQDGIQKILPKNDLINIFKVLFPLVLVSGSDGDKYFEQGCLQAHRIQARFENKGELDVAQFTSCLVSFRTSWEQNNNLAAIANYVSLSLLYCACISEENESLNAAIFSEQELDYLDTKKYLLKNQYNPSTLKDVHKRKHAFFNDCDKTIMEYIRYLKASSDFCDLADYYLPVMYFVGFVDNDFEPETNQRIFADILIHLYKLENKYAISTISQFEAIS